MLQRTRDGIANRSGTEVASPIRIQEVEMRTMIIALFAALPLLGQAVPSAEEATKLFAEERWEEVERAYRARTLADPADGVAWLRLGIALQEQAKIEGALAAFDRAEANNAPSSEIAYRRGRAAARRGDDAKAFAELDSAVARGFRDARRLWREPDLRPLHADPRFAALDAAIESAAHPCRDSVERSTLDYWLGEWDVFDPSGRRIATSSIQRILDGCVVFENYEATFRPYAGKSFSTLNSASGEWEQVYVDTAGSYRPWKGGVQDGLMVFYRELPGRDGKVMLRMSYERPEPDVVRQVIDVSTDDGATWTTNWEGRYVRRK